MGTNRDLIVALRLKSWALLHEVSAYVVSERFRQLNELLTKRYNPNQPRVPGGSPDGGQWTSEGGGGGGGGTIVPEEPRGTGMTTPGTIPDFGSDAGGIVLDAPSGSQAGGIILDGPARSEPTGMVLSTVSEDNSPAYPMGGEIINPNTGEPYSWPEDLDVEKNTRFAYEFNRIGGTQVEKTLVMGYLFRTGGPEDYQRPRGLLAALAGDRQMQYRDATNYNYGAVAAAMGYTKEEALSAAGTYNRYFGNTNQPNMTSYGITADAVNNISHGFSDYQSGYWPHPL